MKSIIKTEKLYKEYKGESKILALEDITISVGVGEKIAVIGMNGSGKSTLLKILCGLIKPTNGSILVDGYIPFKKQNDFLKKIGLFCSDSFQMDEDSLKVKDKYLINKDIYNIEEDFFQRQLSFFSRFFNFMDLYEIAVDELSYGQRALVEICLTLLHRPKILFLDEITVGLDFYNRLKILNLLKEYIKENKATCIFTSHNIKDIIFLADKILILDKAKKVFFGKLKDIKKIEKKSIVKILFLDNKINKIFLRKLRENGFQFEIQDCSIEVRVAFKDLIFLLELINNYLDFIDMSIESENLDELIYLSLKND